MSDVRPQKYRALDGSTHCTTKGHVIYKRRPHAFTVRDAVRIIKAVLLAHNDRFKSAKAEFNKDWADITGASVFIFCKMKGIPVNLALVRSTLEAYATTADLYGFALESFFGGIFDGIQDDNG